MNQNKIYKCLKKILLVVLLIIMLFSNKISALDIVDNYANNILTIGADKTISDDENGYLTLVHKPNDAYAGEGYMWIKQDYNGSNGISRVTYKIDKNFILNNNSYYDITLEYYDNGVGTILIQSSPDQNNTINYSKTGYGGYPEEEWFDWGDSASIHNITHSLENTKEFKSYTFKVSDDFFDDNVDNYLHIYYGRSVNYEDLLQLKSITITKRNFKIDSIDKNNENNKPFVGNLYTESDFGMGFRIFNSSDSTKYVNVSYQILDKDNNLLTSKEFNNIYLNSNEELLKYIDKPEKYGTYVLKVFVEDQFGNIEEESIEFSKMIENLTNKKNDFVGLNSFFSNNSWSNDRMINSVVSAGERIGIDNIRTFINGSFVRSDIESGIYNNKFGRYEDLLDSLTNNYNRKVLFNTDPYDAFIEVDNQTNYITNESLNKIIDETVNIYSNIATKYGNKSNYYEILNEWDLIKKEVSLEQFAEIQIRTALAIRNIDKNAIIVSVSSNRIPMYSNDDYLNFSENSWFARVLNKTILFEGNTLSLLDVVDAISVHPYTTDLKIPPEVSKNNIPSSIKSLEELRKMIEFYKNKHGINKDIPIWISEFGYSVIGDFTEREQASYLTRFLIWGLANRNKDRVNVEKMYVWSLNEVKFSNSLMGESFAMLSPLKSDNKKSATRYVELSARESYVALDMYNLMLNSNEFDVSEINDLSNNNYYLYRFTNKVNKKTIYVVWNDEKSVTSNVNLELLKGKAKIYDMYGNLIKEEYDNDNNVSVDINFMPQYIEVEPEYTVVFDSCGGSDVFQQKVLLNSNVEKPSNPTKEGYTFKEWQLDGKTFDFLEKITSDITLNAVWDINEYTLKEILETEKFVVKNEFVYGFKAGSSVDLIMSRLNDSNVKIITNTSNFGTGTIIEKNNERYSVVIKGDLNGDGKINSGDLLLMRKHLLEEINLEGAYKYAGIIESISDIKSLDLFRLRQNLLGEYVIE